jgi:hypothetical protein
MIKDEETIIIKEEEKRLTTMSMNSMNIFYGMIDMLINRS